MLYCIVYRVYVKAGRDLRTRTSGSSVIVSIQPRRPAPLKLIGYKEKIHKHKEENEKKHLHTAGRRVEIFGPARRGHRSSYPYSSRL